MSNESQIGLVIHFLSLVVSPAFFPKYIHLPSGNLTQLWKITIFNGKTHYKSPFSIAMLNYQRVHHIFNLKIVCWFLSQSASEAIGISVSWRPLIARSWKVLCFCVPIYKDKFNICLIDDGREYNLILYIYTPMVMLSQ